MAGCPEACADRARVRDDLRSALTAARNPVGGWAYRAGNRSRIEPTAWSLLALQHTGRPADDTQVLGRWPRHEGWLIDVAGAPPNVTFNALAALTLIQDPSTAARAEPTIQRILRSRGDAMRQDDALRQDNSLRAWSWVEGTFSWVEPTAWCVLLLKHRLARGPLPGAAARIEIAERMLLDRACQAGGWNFGNPHVFGQDLPPYVPTTAVALIGMQDRAADPVVRRALAGLQADAARERSAMALAWTVICLRVYGVDATRFERSLEALITGERAGVGRADDIMGLAMALYALGDRSPAAFTLPGHA